MCSWKGTWLWRFGIFLVRLVDILFLTSIYGAVGLVVVEAGKDRTAKVYFLPFTNLYMLEFIEG